MIFSHVKKILRLFTSMYERFFSTNTGCSDTRTKKGAMLARGLTLAEAGNIAEAIKYIQPAISGASKKDVDRLAAFGTDLLKTGNYHQATLLFTELKSNFKQLPAGLIGLAEIAQKKQNWKSCVHIWEECFARHTNQTRPFWYISLATAYMECKQKNKAIPVLQACNKRFPESIYAYLAKMKAAQLRGKWEEALEYSQLCFDRFPNEIGPWFYIQRENILVELKRVDEAEELALSQIKRQHGNECYHIMRKSVEKTKACNLSYRYLFIVTYGRSGSTLLQGLLNSIDGVIIKGENGNAFYDLYTSYQKLTDYKHKDKGALLPNQSWYGIGFLSEKDLLEQYRQLAYHILIPEKLENRDNFVFGFKEIRYDEVGDDFESYLLFLRKLFPESAFIFNTRNLVNVTKSGWWKNKDQQSTIENLQTLEQKFYRFYDEDEHSFHITYEDIVNKNNRLKELYSFLGAPYSQRTVDLILQIPHSYNPEQQHIKKLLEK